jgi:hypothetical protein
MKRDIYKQLMQWKLSKRRKPLLIRGARQVGKTYILQEFGAKEYDKVFYCNFEEKPALNDFFKESLSPDKLLNNLSLYFNDTISEEKDLLIFDEIQISNQALNALKYFCENAKGYHIACAGSLIGVKVSGASSFPVGKVNFLDMYPMTFLEFLDACQKSNLRTFIEQTKSFESYPLPFHNELIDYLKKYFFIGGMPEAVSYFSETGKITEIRDIQHEIVNAYQLDFAKHAPPTDIPKLQIIWDLIPAQLAKENKKFIFSAIRKSARAREYENAIQWLKDAGLIYLSYQVTTPKFPLSGYITSAFKMFMLDIGILGAMAKLGTRILLEGDQFFTEFKGAFIENYVAQQLKAEKQADLFYWVSSGKKAEIDFLCEIDGTIFPLETKAAINPRSKSLKSYDQQFSPKVLSRTTLLNLKQDGIICNYPLYSITLFPELGENTANPTPFLG